MRLHAYVSGVVQGVFFRKNTKEQANRLGLKGWVKNLSDGRVEVVAEGEESKLKELLEWIHQGPPSASVTGVESEWLESTREFKGFRILY
ncbi:acylphosphatase [archaeon]|nr:acylphosphatase [archaeon]